VDSHPVIPPIINTGVSTPCPSCSASRLYVITGMFGAEMEKHQRGEEGRMENRLHCRACGYIEGVERTERKEAPQRSTWNNRGDDWRSWD
jgi:hypothetical protein